MDQIFTLSFLAGLLGNIVMTPLGEKFAQLFHSSNRKKLLDAYNRTWNRLAIEIAETEGLTEAQRMDIRDTLQNNFQGLYAVRNQLADTNKLTLKVLTPLYKELNIAWEGIPTEKGERILGLMLNNFMPTFSQEIVEESDLQTLISYFTLQEINKKLSLSFSKAKALIIPPPQRDTIFVGREKDLIEIHTLLQANHKVAIVKGFGGIGKTRLATEYYNHYKAQYQSTIWLPYLNSFIETFTENLPLRVALSLEPYIESIRGQADFQGLLFNKIKDSFRQYEGNNLCIIDDIKVNENDNISDISLGEGWKTLCTSREHHAGYKNYELGFLSVEELVELFKAYYTIDDNQALIEDIILTLHQHTLTIELLAHIAQRQHWNLTTVIEKLQSQNLEILRVKNLKGIPHFDSSHISFENIEDYLFKVFSLTEISKEERLLLKKIAILPAIPINYELLFYLFCKETENEEAQEDFRYFINQLYEKSLIFGDIQNNSYYLHPLLAQVLNKKLGIDYAFVEPFINKLISKFKIISKKNIFNTIFLVPFFLHFFNKWQNNTITIGASYNIIGVLYRNQGNYQQALLYFQKAISIQKSISGEININVANTYNNIGVLYDYQGNYQQALLYFQKAINIQEYVLEKKDPNLTASYNNIGELYRKQKNYQQALLYFQKAITIQKEILGEKNPNLATFYNNIGSLYIDQKNYQQALLYFQKAITIQEEVLEENHPSLATSYNNIGLLYYNQNNYSKTLFYYQKAIIIKEKYLGEKHPSFAISYNNIGDLYRKQKNYQQAFIYFQKAIKIDEETPEKNYINLAISYNNMAFLYNDQKNYTQALTYQTLAVKNIQNVLAPTHPDRILIEKNYQYYLSKQKK